MDIIQLIYFYPVMIPVTLRLIEVLRHLQFFVIELLSLDRSWVRIQLGALVALFNSITTALRTAKKNIVMCVNLQAREMLLPYLGDGLPLHSVSAMIAGMITTVASLPMDIVKTRYDLLINSLWMQGQGAGNVGLYLLYGCEIVK